MTFELITGLITMAFVTSVTPGPNNLMLMTSGANFGLRRTIPHWLGVSVGFVVLASFAGSGAAKVLETNPTLQHVMRIVCVGYLLWLAWKIATSSGHSDQSGRSSPLSFLQAAAFQWVNPKVWAMALAAISIYAPSGGIAQVVLVSCIFGSVNFPAVGLWAVAGTKINAIFRNPLHLRFFNVAMAVLLVLSLAPLFL
ncbi:hypothetical protein RA28_09800 [Ruegeria sp. ANG-S4]|uniref:LysE family translocator n=1 Tax=Ruegeria sp. ANG-S4 TaxID=1577904 RepID=UPI00057D6C15|nr:LysE family translocator [Ruegeria sp. ANG-S4]KIC46094.1 hypothetical protein RA28_09800 [Ruegeria sp. ANG-S4]